MARRHGSSLKIFVHWRFLFLSDSRAKIKKMKVWSLFEWHESKLILKRHLFFVILIYKNKKIFFKRKFSSKINSSGFFDLIINLLIYDWTTSCTNEKKHLPINEWTILFSFLKIPINLSKDLPWRTIKTCQRQVKNDVIQRLVHQMNLMMMIMEVYTSINLYLLFN